MALRPLCCSEAPRLGMSRRGAGWLPGTMTHPATQDGSVTHEETAYARASTYDDPTEDPVSTARIICLAGGINPIGAKMAEALGYDAFYMSGGNTSAHQLGWPDSGTSMRDMVDTARKIVLTVEIPVFADADTGYGDAISTHYTVREYIQAGIAGAHSSPGSVRNRKFPASRAIRGSFVESGLRSAIKAAKIIERLCAS